MTMAVEDLMVRYHRMRGYRTLYVPGTDHAAIATQSKVERLVYEQEGKTRYDLGREELLLRVEEFAHASHDTIVNQARRMGASLDWSREAYTLDEPRRLAVFTAFKRMYDDGLIYRGYRTVNWSVQGQSTHSDEEVDHIERDATLYTFTYDKDFPIPISTTRPETKLGDTAVAVHPGDARYRHFIGQTFTVDVGAERPLSIRVIGDEGVDPSFGTGAVGVTPAHSHIDYEMSRRHNLELIAVIGEDGRMLPSAGKEYVGLSVEEARAKFVEHLRREGLLIAEENVKQTVGVSSRFGDVIEVIPKLQWWVDVQKTFTIRSSSIVGISAGQRVTLKELMLHVVRTGQIRFVPSRFEDVYYNWINNFQDWCISRQIWYGHRIPVWYKKNGADSDIRVSETAPGAGWEQDSDTLDTWFSSGLWTFSTLGWPQETDDLKTYHPTSVLETGHDILFFWVARMILMTGYLLGDVPFRTVYLHGLVRDEHGKKMSKSLGNTIDPLNMIDAYGTDALRLSLIIGTTPGNDAKMSVEKISGFKNFTNKLWNIARFMLLSIETPRAELTRPRPATLADTWILERLDTTINAYHRHLGRYEYSAAGELLREFTWNDLADWYLEVAKLQLSTDKRQSTIDILNYVLIAILKLWHPYMPYVTEAIWHEAFPGSVLMAQRIPDASPVSLPMIAWFKRLVSTGSTLSDMQKFAIVQNCVSALRNLRAEQKIEPAKKVEAFITAGKHAEWLRNQSDIIASFARLKNLSIEREGEPAQRSVTAVVSGIQVYLGVEGVVDTEAERERITKELENLYRYIGALEKKLNNPEFIRNAPAHIVQAERTKLSEAQGTAKTLRDKLKL